MTPSPAENPHVRQAREFSAVLAQLRDKYPERRRWPLWKQSAQAGYRDIAAARKALGFELTLWDRQNLEGAA